MKVGIIGLGYVGLPLAVAFAESGHEVVGLDADQSKIESLRQRRSYVEDIPDGVLEACGDLLKPTSSYADLASCHAVIICVPTPLTGIPRARPHLPPGLRRRRSRRCSSPSSSSCSESTTYPGTTRERLLPILEESGMAAGRDFHLAFSPERIDPGRTDFTVRTTPKVVGGLNEACTERARELYSLVCEQVIVLSTPRRRSWRSCWRTSSARSTSPWSTSLRSSATGWGSTSGR